MKLFSSAIAKVLVAIALSFGFGVSASFAAYTQNIVAQTAFQTVTNNWAAADDDQLQVPIGFGFTFNGITYNNVWINSNGALSFTAGFTTYSNTAMPVATPADVILPYWEDLNRPAGGTITYGTLGVAPNRQFVVSWNAVPIYPTLGSCTFQVVLGEDRSIRFRYSTTSVSCDGSSATTGVQESTTSFIQRSLNAVIPFNQDVLYLVSGPSVSVKKTSAVVCDPINGTTNPKNLPGSISRWTISVSNVGTVSADLTQMTDALSAITTFDPNLVVGATAATCNTSAPPGVPLSAVGRAFNISVAGTTRTGYPKFLTGAADADGATFTAPSSIVIDFAQALPVMTGYTAGQLKPGETVTIYFNVKLN
jgi:uncharacterized repeat protein (TIGR01451 family)